MFNVDPTTMDKDSQVLFFKSQGYTEEEIPGVLAAIEKGLITTKQPGGSSVAMTTHEDPANQDKVRAKEGNAKTVPASESNKSDALMDDDEDDENEDGVPDDEEYEKSSKSFGTDEYREEYVDALAKAGGPDVSRQFDASVALDVMRTTNADMFGNLAYEVYTLKSMVSDLLATVKAETKVIKGKIVESHNKNVTFVNDSIVKALGAQAEEIGTIAKSLSAQPAASTHTGVVTRVVVGNDEDIKKALPITLRRDDIEGDKLAVGDLLHKSLADDDLRSDASAALSRLDRVKNYDQLEQFIGTRNPALFGVK